ncbi:MAG: sulfurtransferase [Dokdonella sp.]|uniref:sulfurtransferase n=1 Tax=Dokdonella sp. TaxID=2291710 RepID=UPI003266C18D
MTLNIAAYRFTPIDDPDALVAQLRERAETLALLGTILVAEEGINLFLAGAADPVARFISGLRGDPRFSDIAFKTSVSDAAPFVRLKVKRKREIISFRRDRCSPLQGRAPALAPATLARWIEQAHDDDGKRLVLLDTRNRDEVRHGTFTGALTLPIERFTDLPDAVEARRDDLEDATIVSFCTGGVRCEKAALWMQANDLGPVWQLDGGILGYFEQVGDYGYAGRCFVFDQRVALEPSLLPMADGAPFPD